jgi:hypothetical protein
MGSATRNGLHKTWRAIVQTTNIYIEIDGEQRAAAFASYRAQKHQTSVGLSLPKPHSATQCACSSA